MKTSSDYDPNSAIAILIAGIPGSRKTTLALQFPNPYIFDADNNMSGPVRHLGCAFRYDIGGVDDDGKEIPPPLRWAHMLKCINIAGQDDSIKTIIMDSMTNIIDYAKAEVLRVQGKAPDTNFEFRDWDKMATLLKHLIITLKTWKNKIIVFTAHESLKEDKALGQFVLRLAIQGALKDTFSGYFSDVWSATVQQIGSGINVSSKHVITTKPMSSADRRGLKQSLGLEQTFDNTPEAFKKILAVITAQQAA